MVFSLEPDHRWMQNMEKQSHALVGFVRVATLQGKTP
jgi:hypothetical protein